jgi:hypothetical protein
LSPAAADKCVVDIITKLTGFIAQKDIKINN